jgi:uncharacterized protein YgiM (DUF1202 family)
LNTNDEFIDKLRDDGPDEVAESPHGEVDSSGSEAEGSDTESSDTAVSGTAGPAGPGTAASARPRVWSGARIGAAGTLSAMFLTLGLHGSSPAAGSAGTIVADPGAAAVTDAGVLDSTDRAIAAARIQRSLDRAPLRLPEKKAEPRVIGKRFTRVDLNVRTWPNDEAQVVAVLDYGDTVTITSRTKGGWRQVIYKGEPRWVKSGYLTRTKPKAKPKGPSTAPCPDYAGGSGMESGLTNNAVRVHRAVCAAFPSVTTYGGIRGGSGNHGTGHAVDIMVSGGTGDAIAAYVRAYAAQLGVTEVIWEQRIWTTQRASDGWRWMSDRGSATDNHYDHVHVTVG